MNKFSTRSLYLQVRDAMTQRIMAGEWRPGTAVPNETDLARELGVSPGTMRKALDMIENEGLVSRRQGRGTFVNDPTSPILATRYNKIRGPDGERIVGTISTLEVSEGPSNDEERERLRLRESEIVCRIRRTRSHNTRTYMTETAILPDALFPGLAETSHCSLGIVAISHTYGVLLGDAVEHVSLGVASQSAAEVLNIAEGSPIFVLDRTIETREGRPAEWRKAECTMTEMHYKVETS